MSDNPPPYSAPPPPPENPYGQSPQGQSPYGQDPYGQQQPRGGSGLAIAALVFGILALLFCWTLVGGIIGGIIALVLGFIARRKAKRGEAGGGGMAIAGMVLGVLGALIAIGIIVVTAVFLNSDTGKNLRDCLNQAGNDTSAQQKCQDEFSKNLSS